MFEYEPLELGTIARTPAESVAPELWPDHAWIPALGFQGGVLFNIVNNKTFDISGWSWDADGVNGNKTNKPTGVYVNDISISDFTIFAKYKTSTFPANSGGDFFGTGISGSNMLLQLENNNGIKMHIWRKGTLSYVLADSVYTNNGWQYACAIVKNNTIYVYHNGRFISSTPISGIGASTYSQLHIGRGGTLVSESWGGKLYNILFYSKALCDIGVYKLTADPLLPFRRRKPVFYSFPLATTPLHIFGRVS